MRADALIRVRVAEPIKQEWSTYADRHGIGLSDFVRTSCRVATLIGHQRLAEGLADLALARRDLHALVEELRRIATTNSPPASEDLRIALARVHTTTDVLSAAIRGKVA